MCVCMCARGIDRMVVSLQHLKAFADAAKRDRSCLQQVYVPRADSATRGQQLSTVCRTSEEAARTQPNEPVVERGRVTPSTLLILRKAVANTGLRKARSG